MASPRHGWTAIRATGDKLYRCGTCGAEKRVSIGGERAYRPHGTAPWASATPFCRPTDQPDFFDDYAFEYADDPLPGPAQVPTSSRKAAPLLTGKPIDARARRGPASPYTARIRGDAWGLASGDPHASLGVPRRPSRLEYAPGSAPCSYEALTEVGFEVTLLFDEEECFEFGLLAEGVPLEADVRWSDVTTEVTALRRAMHQMTIVARELTKRGCTRGARAAMKNRTNGDVFIWKFDQGMWRRASSL